MRRMIVVLASMAFVVIALAAGTAGAVPTTTTTAPAGPARATFSIVPASSKGADDRAAFSYAVTANALLYDHVAAVNYSDVPLTFQLYATDALEAAGGGLGLLAPGATPTAVGSWITLPAADATVTVPARTAEGPGQAVVPFTLHVPVGTTPGDHLGAIVLSLRTQGTNSSGQTVILNQRVGARVLVRVAGPLTASASVTGIKATYQGSLNPIAAGSVDVSYLVTNTGNTDLALTQQVTAGGLVGPEGRTTVPRVNLLLPGASLPEQVVVNGAWPTFRVHANVIVHLVPLEGTGAGAVPPVTASASTWAVPWTLLLVIVVLIAALLLWRSFRRRGRRQPEAAAPPEAREAVRV